MERGIDVPEHATVAEAADLVAALTDAIVEDGPYVLRGGAVRRIDGACLQALVSFYQTAAALGWKTRWDGASESLQSSAALLGLTQLLGFEPAQGQA